MTMAEQLYEVGSKLPPPALAELLDFAEFFAAEMRATLSCAANILGGTEGGWKIPYFCRIAPVHPEKMRREWD